MKKIKELKEGDTAYIFNKSDCTYEECEIKWTSESISYLKTNKGCFRGCDITPNYEYYAVPTMKISMYI